MFTCEHFSCTIAMQQIIHLIIFDLDYHGNAIDGEWFHVTFQYEEVCDGWSLVAGRSRHISHG